MKKEIGQTKDVGFQFELEKQFKIENGIEGSVRVLKPYSHIRLNWKKKGWENISTVQVRVI